MTGIADAIPRRTLLQNALGTGAMTVFATVPGSGPVLRAADAKPVSPSDFHIFHVIPATKPGGVAGTGSAADPFKLAAGGEYALNQLIRKFMDCAVPLVVRFGDGVYQDVRLQIVREGIDTTTIYLRERKLDPDGHTAIGYRSTAQCNRSGGNCRVLIADFAVSRGLVDAPLLLMAEHSGLAIFDGSGLSGLPELEDTALLISGSVTGAAADASGTRLSRRIRNIQVQGLAFRNYRNGIQITYAETITISGCSLVSIGNRDPRHGCTNCIATFGLRVDGDSRQVLIVDNRIEDLWNIVASEDGDQDKDDPGLIHGVYQGYAHDVVYKDNWFAGCSGPMVKFGYYPIVTNGALISQYPTTPRQRCSLFVGNSFLLRPIDDVQRTVPTYAPEQAMIDENSMLDVAGTTTAASGGMIFVANRFTNALPARQDVPVVFLRQEITPSMTEPSFPGWAFLDNVISGVAEQYLVAVRTRGTALTAASIRPTRDDFPLRVDLLPQDAAAATIAASADADRQLAIALAAISTAADAEANRELLAMASTGMQSWQPYRVTGQSSIASGTD